MFRSNPYSSQWTAGQDGMTRLLLPVQTSAGEENIAIVYRVNDTGCSDTVGGAQFVDLRSNSNRLSFPRFLPNQS